MSLCVTSSVWCPRVKVTPSSEWPGQGSQEHMIPTSCLLKILTCRGPVMAPSPEGFLEAASYHYLAADTDPAGLPQPVCLLHLKFHFQI